VFSAAMFTFWSKSTLRSREQSERNLTEPRCYGCEEDPVTLHGKEAMYVGPFRNPTSPPIALQSLARKSPETGSGSLTWDLVTAEHDVGEPNHKRPPEKW
jgi:hypothetical protein